jgi:copper chaperone CopZ
MSLFPLPPDDWVGPQECSTCDGKPDFLQEDMRPICNKCIDLITRGLNKKESKTEVSIPITTEIISRTRFEWSTDNEKWYSIKGKNIKTDRPDVFLKELKESILEKRPITVEADYDKDKKEMNILL